MRIPFKAIIDRRPYPPTGMTTARWIDEVPVTNVWLHQLTLTQTGVRIAPLFRYLTDEHTWSGDKYPHVVQYDGELYLEDGHHRVIRAQLVFGYDVMKMRVLTMAPAEVPCATS